MSLVGYYSDEQIWSHTPLKECVETVYETNEKGEEIQKTRKVYIGIDGRVLKADPWQEKLSK